MCVYIAISPHANCVCTYMTSRTRCCNILQNLSLSSSRRLHPAAILCLGMPEPNVVVTGSYDKHVRLLDLRQPVSVQSSYKEHTRPVLTLAATDWYIYTGSEDKTLCVWDRRNEKELQRIKVGFIISSVQASVIIYCFVLYSFPRWSHRSTCMGTC